MATTVYKQLATMQDLALGIGKVTQQRNGQSIELDKIDIGRLSEVSSIDELSALPGGTILDRLIVTGYNIAGDGGGGPNRVWKDGAGQIDNRCSIVVPGGTLGSVSTIGAWVWSYSGPVNSRWCGATGLGIVDESPVYQIMSDAGFKSIYSPAGVYKLLSQVSWDYDVEFYGDGKSTVFDATYAPPSVDRALYFAGPEPTQISNIDGSLVKGDRTVVFLAAHGLSVGDVFIIYDPADYSWSQYRPVYRAGEYCEVESAAEFSVTVKSPLYDSYPNGSTNAYKFNHISINLHDFIINGKDSANVVKADYIRDSDISRVTATNANNTCLQYLMAFNCTMNNVVVSNIGDGGDDYGVSIANSQHIRVNDSNIYSRRHAVTIGGGGQIGSVTNRDVRIRGGVLRNAESADIGAADFHGNTEDCSYENMSIYGGVTWQGRNTGYVNCNITATGIGAVLMSSELNGGLYYLESCKLYTDEDPQPEGRGIIDVGGNNTSAFNSLTPIDCTFRVKNCTLNSSRLSALTTFFLFKNRGAVVNANFDIDNLIIDTNNLSSVLLTENVSGTPESLFIIVDNITSPKPGIFLHNAIGDAYAGFAHRLPILSGSLTTNSSIGLPYILYSAVVYRYSFPRKPHLVVARHSEDLVGNRMGIPYANPASISQFTPTVYTDDGTNFSAVESVTFDWSATIREI